MSKEQKSTEKIEKQSVQPEFKQIENMAVESAVAASGKRRNRTFMGMIAVAVVLIAVLIGIGVYNTPANRMSRHLDLGTRYLEGQNYEQAVVEFDQVIAIDPMSADAYLGKAQAYEGMGDTEKTIETLVAGYERTGDEQIQMEAADCFRSYIEQLIDGKHYDEAETLISRYLGKVPGVEFQAYLDEIAGFKAEKERKALLADIIPFDAKDIKILGYDLLEPHFEEVAAASGFSYGDTDMQNNEYVSVYDGREETGHSDNVNGEVYTDSIAYYYPSDYYQHTACCDYMEWYVDGVLTSARLFMDNAEGAGQKGVALWNSWCELPVYVGDTYEEWHEKAGIDQIANFPDVNRRNVVSDDENNTVGNAEMYLIKDHDKDVISYEEEKLDDGELCTYMRWCLTGEDPTEIEKMLTITVTWKDGVAERVYYEMSYLK